MAFDDAKRKKHMERDFYHYWFNGFEESLKNICENDKNILFKNIGKACSDSYTRDIYINEYNESENIYDFIVKLKKRFPEMEINLINENEINILYHYCACDLVEKGYIKTPAFCECSRQSLLYNWESILGKDNVEIKLIHSILEGNDTCLFSIKITEGGFTGV